MGLRYLYIKLANKRNIKRINDSDSHPKTYSIKQLAGVYGLTVIERSDINGSKFQELIKQYEPDLFISVASPIIFKESLIKIPKLDCINIHSAPLPKYRGMLPNFWQLYHGEKEAGITIHKIDCGIDTGDIIAQSCVPIESHDSLNDLIIKTKKQGAHLMIGVIEDFRKGKVEYKKMKGESSYFSFPTRKEVLELRKRGRKLL